jgi:predicted O-linked N-acetylglucosamine transferase (SPINDLY family)
VNIDKILQTAREYHQAGNLEQAELLCKKILHKKPDRSDVLLLVGILHYERKQYDAAIQYLQKTIQAAPHSADAYYNLANAYADKGLTDEAIVYYQKAIEINPRFTYTYNNLGITFHEKKRYDEAIACFKKAIEIDPQLADAYYNLGTVYQDMKQGDLAVPCYQKALHLNPYNADAYFNMGTIFEKKGLAYEAIAQYQKAQQLSPRRDDVYFKIGTIFKEKGLLDNALSYLRLAAQMNPHSSDSLINLGAVLRDKGNLDEAIVCYKNVIAINPGHFEAYNNLGIVYSDRGLFDESIKCFQKSIELNPNFAEAYNNLGNVYRTQGMVRQAAVCFETALLKNPMSAEARNNLGIVLEEQGKPDEAEARYRQAVTLKPDMHTAYSNLLLLMNYSRGYDAETIFAEHIKFSKLYAEPLASTIVSHTNNRSLDRKLKIGYVSPDFRQHSVAYFIEPVLAAHSTDIFEIFCYSDVLSPDKVTERLRQYDVKWTNIVGISDPQAADMIRQDRIDILVDLAGHTGPNRILLFTRKPAPLQISWIGYPNTTGFVAMDYKIVDNFTDPPGMTEQFYSEKLIRMPDSFLCYMPDRESPEIGDSPAAKKRNITFGSFNKYSKVTPHVIEIWTKILKKAPDTRLVMKARSFADEATRSDAVEKFVREGVSPERVETLPPHQSVKEHIAAYNEIDICLDTFPYNGTTTTCEALWMGVPVITLEGQSHVSRVGFSILSNTCLQEFIAKTPEEYVEKAVNLANNIAQLQLLRQTLRDKMLRSPLMDKQRFTHRLEDIYRRIWEDWARGKEK